MKHSSIELTNQLLQKIGTIKLNDATTILGGSSAGVMLNDLRSAAAALHEAITSKQSYEVIMERYEKLAGAVDTAGVTGLISETELTSYYELIDSIWAAIEKEKDRVK